MSTVVYNIDKFAELFLRYRERASSVFSFFKVKFFFGFYFGVTEYEDNTNNR